MPRACVAAHAGTIAALLALANCGALQCEHCLPACAVINVLEPLVRVPFVLTATAAAGAAAVAAVCLPETARGRASFLPQPGRRFASAAGPGRQAAPAPPPAPKGALTSPNGAEAAEGGEAGRQAPLSPRPRPGRDHSQNEPLCEFLYSSANSCTLVYVRQMGVAAGMHAGLSARFRFRGPASCRVCCRIRDSYAKARVAAIAQHDAGRAGGSGGCARTSLCGLQFTGLARPRHSFRTSCALPQAGGRRLAAQ